MASSLVSTESPRRSRLSGSVWRGCERQVAGGWEGRSFWGSVSFEPLSQAVGKMVTGVSLTARCQGGELIDCTSLLSPDTPAAALGSSPGAPFLTHTGCRSYLTCCESLAELPHWLNTAVCSVKSYPNY